MDAKQNVLNLRQNLQATMKLQFLGFPKDKPTQVVMDYDDFVKIATQLNLPIEPNPVAEGISGMEWYSLMESSHSIINSLIALTSREQLSEMDKPLPDKNRIAELESLNNEAWKVSRDPQSFKDMPSMQAIVDKFSPILLAEKKKLNLNLPHC